MFFGQNIKEQLQRKLGDIKQEMKNKEKAKNVNVNEYKCIFRKNYYNQVCGG